MSDDDQDFKNLEIQNQSLGSIIIPKSSKNKNSKKSNFFEDNDGLRSTQTSNMFDHIANENRSIMSPTTPNQYL